MPRGVIQPTGALKGEELFEEVGFEREFSIPSIY